MRSHLFRNQTSSVRYVEPCTIVRAMAICPPGWHTYIREAFHVVLEAGGRVWDCEPKWGTLHLGVELPAEISDETVAALNALVAAADAACEGCGRPGRLRDEHEFWRTLCDECVRVVERRGWRDVRSRRCTG